MLWTLTLCCVGVLPSAYADVIDWFNDQVFNKITISGTQRFGLHMHQIEGDEETYYEQWNRGRRAKISDERYLTISGKNVLGVLNFDLQINNHPFATPYDHRVSVNYDRNGIKADLGDIQASLAGNNSLVRFSRSMRGGQVQYTTGNLQVKGVYSQTKSSARTLSFAGNNSAGPYYLGAGMIAEGSIHVRVDDIDQKLGEDYVVNSYAGTITFLNKTIPPSSTIVVTYETLALNQNQGDILGGAVSYKVHKDVSLGYMRVEQRPRTSTSLMQLTEEFYGYGPPNMPYYLSAIPSKDFPIVVTLDGILQTEGVDYYFDDNNPQVFYFNKYVPPTSLIRVTYTPLPEPGTFGNGKRVVEGYDVTWSIAKGQRLNFSMAKSTLFTPTGIQEGTAKAVTFNYDLGKLNLQTRWHDIPSSFVSIESTGFARNETGLNLRSNYDAGKGLKFGLSATDVKVQTPVFDGTEFSTVSGKTRSLRFDTTYQPSKTQTYYFNATGFDGNYSSQKNNRHRLSAGFKSQKNKWNFDFSTSYETVNYASFDENNPKSKSSDVISGRVNSSYTFSDKLSLLGGIGINSITGSDGSSVGHDFNLRAEWKPSDTLSMNLQFADTYSGLLTGFGGFIGGDGFGYNGNGFSGGSSGYIYNPATSKTKLYQVQVQWRPNSRLSIEPYLTYTDSEGENVANSKALVASVNTTWSPSDLTHIGARVDHALVTLTGGTGTSSSTLLSFGIDHRFTPRLKSLVDFTFSMAGGPGLGQFAQKHNSIFFNTTYDIEKRQRVFVEFRKGNVSGYLADVENYFGLGYAYDIIPGVALKGIYRFRDRSLVGASSGSGGYKASGFDLELEINFRR